MGQTTAPAFGQAALTGSVAWREHVGRDDPDVSCGLPADPAPGAEPGNSQRVV